MVSIWSRPQSIYIFDKYGNYILSVSHLFWSQPPTMMDCLHIDHTRWQTIMQIDPWNTGYEINLNILAVSKSS